MQTQIQCPQCRAPVVANVEQIIDVDRYPQLKQALLGGALNVAQCRNCGWAGQVAMPLVYHDSAHDLLISFVPMELNLPYAEQERMMGQLVRRVVDSVPNEQRRAYLLQPRQMFRWQTFMETVLEKEGITKEMIDRQRQQIELLQTLARTTDQEVTNILLAERKQLLDETFVAMVQQTLQSATQADGPEVIQLSNLQAWLMRNTEAGRRIERRQMALHQLNRDAKKANGVTPQMIVDHVVANAADEDVVDALVEAVGGPNYEFFSALSARLDAAAKQGDKVLVDQLTAHRTRLLKLYDEMRAASDKLLRDALALLNRIVGSRDRKAALAQYANRIDEPFLYVLDSEIQRARSQADLDRSLALQEVKKLLDDMMQEAAPPPEIQLLTLLLRAPGEAEMRQVLDANPQLVGPDLVTAIDALSEEMVESAPPELLTRLREIRGVISARLALS